MLALAVGFGSLRRLSASSDGDESRQAKAPWRTSAMASCTAAITFVTTAIALIEIPLAVGTVSDIAGGAKRAPELTPGGMT